MAPRERKYILDEETLISVDPERERFPVERWEQNGRRRVGLTAADGVDWLRLYHQERAAIELAEAAAALASACRQAHGVIIALRELPHALRFWRRRD